MTENLYNSLRNTERVSHKLESEVLNRGVNVVLPSKESLAHQMKQRRIKLYLGIDPTSPDLHIGHVVPLRKLRQFQDLGHEVILLFGTFTGMIGDPSDKSAARVRLSREEIDHNIVTYAEQASKVLDMSTNAENPIIIKHNHEWLSKLTFEEVVELSSNFTVQQMLRRNMFQKRMKEDKPVHLHEFFYPLMQGYDAVAMDVDLEIGGKDQLFNMMTGRVLVERYRGHEKWVMGTKLIEDPSGKKMGKTEGNIVNINDYPEVAYEALMTWPDTAVPLGLELLTDVPMETINQIENDLPSIISGESEIHIVDLKEGVAHRIVNQLHGEKAADYAQEEFDRVKRKKQEPRKIKETKTSRDISLSSFLLDAGLAHDLEEAQSRITQGAIYVDNKRIRKDITMENDMVIKIGKRTIGNIRRAVVE